MSKKTTFISVSLTDVLKEKVDARLAESDFSSASEYLRTLIRADLARQDFDQLVGERLKLADQGGPFIKQEDAEAYFDAKDRGENPAFPTSSQL